MSINYVDPKSIVTNLYDQFSQMSFLDWEHPERGLHVVFDVHASELGYRKGPDGTEDVHHPEWEKQVGVYLHVIVTSRRRMYHAYSSEYKPEKVDPKLWTNGSNHDSCWPSSMPFDDWYFWACEYVQQAVPDEHKKPPYMVHVTGRFGGFITSPGLNFVKVTREPIEGEHYFDKLTKVEQLKFKIVVEDEEAAQ